MQETLSTEREVISRRSFLIAAGGLCLAQLSWAQGEWNSILYWQLNREGDTARETISGANSPIESRTGHAIWVGEGRDYALRLDGYSVWISHEGARLPGGGGALTFSCWLAMESYPVSEAAIVNLQFRPDAKLSLFLDRWGYLGAGKRNGASEESCKSSRPVPKLQWHHVAAVFADSGIAVYIDGDVCGHAAASGSRSIPSDVTDVTLGRSPDSPEIAGVFPTGVLNGLMREVRVFSRALSLADLTRLREESKSSTPPDLQINGAWCADDPHRPQYHAIPPRAWTNEPHGLIHWGGQYHLFYQKNPNGPYWGHINWGHMTGPDLYRWTEQPVALSPEPGPDSEGCWSGSVIDHNGKLAIIYTAGDGHRASICLAHSEDGVHFTKHPANPIIPNPPVGQGFPEFRDPFVWREGKNYYLIIGSAITGKGGTALLYRSKDLVNWDYRKPLLVGDRESSGVFWEMPIFVKLGDQHALVVCEVPGRASYWVGTWKDETFTPHSEYPQRLELFNHLLSPTPHRLDDGRLVTMGIIPDERSPKECWRAGWAHHYSLPRLVSADAQGRLHQAPLEGIENRLELVASISNLDLPDGSMKQIEQASGTALNVRAVFNRGNSHSASVRVRCSPDKQEYTEIRYYWDIGRLVLDRTRSSLDPDVRRDIQEATWFPDTKDSLELNLFLDQSVLEVFVDKRSAFAARIYPMLPASTGVWVGSEGPDAKMESLTVKRIKRSQ